MVRESNSLLKDKRITPDQFLDRMVFIFTKKIDEIASCLMDNESETSTSDNEEEALGELSLTEPPVQAPLKGLCIACRSAQCDIILTPCFDIVVCSKCWSGMVDDHKKQCEIIYKKNKRKLVLEKKNVPCPSCQKVVKNAQPFFMATISG